MKSFFYACIAIFPIFALSSSWANTPFEVDAYEQSRGFNPTRDHQDQTLTEHIDLLTGNLFLHQTDFYLPGKAGLDLKIIRNYNAGITEDARDGIPLPSSWVGRGWSLHLGKLYIPASLAHVTTISRLVMEMPDGSRHVFYHDKLFVGDTLITKDFWRLFSIWEKHGTDSSRVYVVTLNNGVRYFFPETLFCGGDWGAHPVRTIMDPNNDSIRVYYQDVAGDGNRFINHINESCGRTTTFFSHQRGSGGRGGVVLDSIRANNMTRMRYYYHDSAFMGYSLLDSVKSSVGLRWKYTYYTQPDDMERLYTVQYPQSGVITYVYGDNTFYQGRTFTYRAVFSRTASPGNYATTYEYGGDGNGDSTTVTAPDGTKTSYRMYGYRSNLQTNENWRIGTILSKRIWGSDGTLIQREAYVWNSQEISLDQELQPTGSWDYSIRAPLLNADTVDRDGTNYLSLYAYGDYGNPITISETGNLSRTIDQQFKTDPAKHIVDRLSSRRVTVGTETFLDSLGYDANGNLIYQNHYGVVTTFVRNTDGTLASETNARYKTTSYNYTVGGPNYGVPRRIYYSIPSIVVNRAINWEGTIASETNARNYTTSFQYDGLNRLTQITPPSPWGASTVITYDNVGGRSKVVTRGSGSVTYSYDEFGRLTRTQNSENVKVDIGYDNMGRKSTESYPYVSIIDYVARSFTYDGLGRVKRMTNPDGTYVENTYTGTSVAVRNERNLTTTYNYQAFGNPDGDRWLMSVIQPLNCPPCLTTNFTYNAVGSLKSTQQLGYPTLTRTYTYDGRNFLTGVTTPEAGNLTYVPDAVGNDSVRIDANFVSTTYTYDELNRLTNINFPGTSYDVAFQYDGASNRTRMAGARDTIWYRYDGSNRDTCEIWKVDARSKYVYYRYDNRDNVNRITYPNGRKIDFTYDTADRLSQIPGYISGTITYHPSGGELSFAYAQGFPLTLTKTYDQFTHRLTSLRVGNSLIYNYNTYDAVGNLTYWVDASPGHNHYWHLDYDNLDRLTAVNLDGTTTNYTYDDYGDRLTSSQGVGWQYTYDNGSTRLKTITYGAPVWRSYTYDNNGNPLTLTTQGQLDSLFYDYDNRLVTYKKKNVNPYGDHIFRHTYQGDGLKVKTYREFAGPMTHQDSVYYIYDRAGRVLEDSVAGGKVRDYIYANGQHLAVFWRTGSDSGKVFYHCDHLGTPVAFSDASGQMIASESYYPFGERLEGSGSFENTHRFTGKERDTTGFDYFGARWYDSGVGRFLNAEPVIRVPKPRFVKNPQFLNPYIYAVNNPLMLIDKNGEEPHEWNGLYVGGGGPMPGWGINPADLAKGDALWLAKAIHGEARGIDIKFPWMVDVGWVMRNRLESGRWGETYEKVVTAPKQFSCFNEYDKNYKVVQNPEKTAGAYLYWFALAAAYKVVTEESQENPVKDALWFYSPESQKPKGSEPYWVRDVEEVIPSHESTAGESKYFRFFKEKEK